MSAPHKKTKRAGQRYVTRDECYVIAVRAVSDALAAIGKAQQEQAEAEAAILPQPPRAVHEAAFCTCGPMPFSTTRIFHDEMCPWYPGHHGETVTEQEARVLAGTSFERVRAGL